MATTLESLNYRYHFTEDTNDILQDSLLKAWRTDIAGCNKIRTVANTRNLIKIFNLENKSETEVIEILGNPDSSSVSKNGRTIIFLIDSYCINGKLARNADYCYARFSFKNQKMNSPKIEIACY